MTDSITVKKDYLLGIYREIKSALNRLEVVLAEIGCVHSNKYEMTTMDGTNLRQYMCPDCGESIEEEIHETVEL